MKSKLTAKGQITIPQKVRRALALGAGDTVAFVEKDGGFLLVNGGAPFVLTPQETMEIAEKRVLARYLPAFKELAK